MLFNSSEFLIFFPVVTVIYFAIPDRVKYLWLLAASYYFYMCWNARYALLLLFSTVVTWVSGLLLDRIGTGEGSVRLRRLVVAGSFALNLGVLFVFKYLDFGIGILQSFFLFFGIELATPSFDLLLPVGISFYTFQALSYTMDIYRGEIYAEKNFFRYALFVSFFPQLVAGPIERSKNLLRQLAVPQHFSWHRLKDGIYLMLWGYFLKIVLADRIALIVDTVYGNPSGYSGGALAAATVLFAVQIYCDFAGYSTIAIGAAEILGVRLMENFDAPYLSCSVAQFWRRWHISLTTWFRDYLYIPLGGGRKGQLRKYINKMIVFLLSGLWHGAAFSYVAWGGLNGLYQVIGEITLPLRTKILQRLQIRRTSRLHLFLCGLFTFLLVDFSWIFFRADSFTEGLRIVRKIFTVSDNWFVFSGVLVDSGVNQPEFILLLACILLLLSADAAKRRGIRVREALGGRSIWLQCAVIALAAAGILLFGIWGPGYTEANFIYFQF